jgi:hypothetical protein
LTIKVQARPTTDIYDSSEGSVFVKALKNGTLSVVDFVTVMSLEGRLFTTDGGGYATTSITCAGAYDADGADYVLDIPEGTAVMPVSIKVTIDTMTDDEDVEGVFYWANLANTVSAGTAVTVYNCNLASSTASGSTCNVAADAAGSTDVSGATRIGTLCRWYGELGAAPAAAQSEEGRLDNGWHYSLLKGDIEPTFVTGTGSGASITGHVMKTTAAKAFISVKFVEFPTAWLS